MSLKQKENWVCSECGHSEVKWSGSCHACKSWNTMQKFIVHADKTSLQRFSSFDAKPIRLSEVKATSAKRIETGLSEFDRFMGGGVVLGSLTLVGGDPGVGKSTLMLMLGDRFCKEGKVVLYVCGEESADQTSERARRLGISASNLFLLSETLFTNIKTHVDSLKPDILILDSIQIVYKGELPALPGSVTQVREIAMECMHMSKQMGITTFVIGHVTKSGEIAGPKVLEHIVDTVLDFEGDRDLGFRILRCQKNRFGPTDEIVLYQMHREGLQEIANPSEIFLKERQIKTPGSAIIPTIEGSRAILVEVQALVATSAFSTCARRASGLDQNRLALLLAVLEKKMGYHFHNLDVFVSIAGGLKIKEPAIDLGIIMSIASSFCNQPIDPCMVLIGEVGLSGEVRSVPRVETRMKEAIQMGFTKCIVAKSSLPKKPMKIEVIGVERVEEVIRHILP